MLLQFPQLEANFCLNNSSDIRITSYIPLLPDNSISFLRIIPYIGFNCALLSVSLPVEKANNFIIWQSMEVFLDVTTWSAMIYTLVEGGQ